MSTHRLVRYIDALVVGTRPPRFTPEPEDVEILRTAIELRGARPGDTTPDQQFVAGLFQELAAQASAERAPIAALNKVRRGRAILATAAASLVLVGGSAIATETAFNRAPAVPTATQAPHAQDVRTGTFLTADDQAMGQIVVYNGHPSWVFMNIGGANYSGPIVCTLQVEDGSTVAVGNFNLHDGRGEFSRSIRTDIGRLRGAKLVTSNGSIVASATFA